MSYANGNFVTVTADGNVRTATWQNFTMVADVRAKPPSIQSFNAPPDTPQLGMIRQAMLDAIESYDRNPQEGASRTYRGPDLPPETRPQHFQLLCPHCGRGDQLQVMARAWYDVTPAGLTESNDAQPSWELTSPCRCIGCGWDGTVKHAQQDDSAAWPQGRPY